MEFDIIKADVNDAEAIADLIKIVHEQLECKDWYIADDEDYIRHQLEPENGIGYKAVEKRSRDLAGMFMAAFPGDSPMSMGWDIGFSAEQCKASAHMDTGAVLPKYRGFHLEFYLMQALERDLREMGFMYLIASVHPENHASRNTMLRQGYKVMLTEKKYGKYLRNIVVKTLV